MHPGQSLPLLMLYSGVLGVAPGREGTGLVVRL